MTVRILHFADAHIDMANYGRYDPESLLPVRVTDYLKSLDTIVDTAIEERVDLVIFAGDAYKDRNPSPTFQREWGRRIMRLSQAGIPTILIVGNHDVSPAAGRAHTLAEFDTFQIHNVFIADKIRSYSSGELGIPVQVIAIPWIPRSHLLTRTDTAGKSIQDIYLLIEERIKEILDRLLSEIDPSIPTILTAHASVFGAKYGSERMVMLGNELVLAQSMVTDPRLDYVALGHIHRHQELNGGNHPPVVYPGSIERIDFGEARETKGFVLAEINRGETEWRFVPLRTRPFVDIRITLESAESVMLGIRSQLPAPESLAGSIVRLQLTYPADWEALIDYAAIEQALSPAFDFKIVKNRLTELRSRLGDTAAVETLSPIELLNLYFKTTGMEADKTETLHRLGADIIRAVDTRGES
ncbi:MAG: exonuclease SbcCD subunit D [Anaerolineales bacterium]|nr:exonuclease SbcCD subunit D [Anaerolineales bacterium]